MTKGDEIAMTCAERWWFVQLNDKPTPKLDRNALASAIDEAIEAAYQRGVEAGKLIGAVRPAEPVVLVEKRDRPHMTIGEWFGTFNPPPFDGDL